jgi:molybdate transport system substrate-binding protein
MKTRVLAFIATLVVATSVSAADLKVLCTNGVKAVVEDLLPKFERDSGDKVTILFEPSTQLRKRIDAGEAFDLVIMTTALIDEEIKSGKLAADSRTFLARAGLGVSIRAGAKKPNIATVNAFKSALLGAESITYATQGASAAPFEVLVAKLGSPRSSNPKHNLQYGRRSRRRGLAGRRRARHRAGQRDSPRPASIWSDRFRKFRATSS